MANLQQRIQNLMSQRNIGATDIEKKTGLNRNTIYGIVAGNSKNPSAHNLQLIAKALDVSLESILFDEDTTQLNYLNTEQLTTFSTATVATVEMIIESDVNISVEKLVNLIKEVYEYSIKATPPTIDDRFIKWLIERDAKS